MYSSAPAGALIAILRPFKSLSARTRPRRSSRRMSVSLEKDGISRVRAMTMRIGRPRAKALKSPALRPPPATWSSSVESGSVVCAAEAKRWSDSVTPAAAK